MEKEDEYRHPTLGPINVKDWASKVKSGQALERRSVRDWSLLLFIFWDPWRRRVPCFIQLHLKSKSHKGISLKESLSLKPQQHHLQTHTVWKEGLPFKSYSLEKQKGCLWWNAFFHSSKLSTTSRSDGYLQRSPSLELCKIWGILLRKRHLPLRSWAKSNLLRMRIHRLWPAIAFLPKPI